MKREEILKLARMNPGAIVSYIEELTSKKEKLEAERKKLEAKKRRLEAKINSTSGRRK
jgi:chromosome segregation ATPase